MSRQHCHPILVPANGPALRLNPLARQGADASLLEADIQAFVHAHPESLPIQEVDPAFVNPIAICRELYTPAGAIDNFLVTAQGFPIIVECKLWRNAEARREVVGQILDYAKELRRWSSSDLQREVRRRLGSGTAANPLLEMVRAVEPNLDEIEFNDALTANLRRGRFLLLIVGDGIRESVEAIAEYLQDHAGLHFSMGLVEFPVYAMPDSGRLVVPRILARTVNITRTVVASPNGYTVEGDAENAEDVPIDSEQSALGDERLQFWREFLDGLILDDPEQPDRSPPEWAMSIFFCPRPRAAVGLPCIGI